MYILQQFNDISAEKNASYGIQNIAMEAITLNFPPGKWFAPSIVASILSKLNDKYMPFPNFSIRSFTNGQIDQKQIL